MVRLATFVWFLFALSYRSEGNSFGSDTVRIWKLHQQAVELREMNQADALRYAEEARKLASKVNFKKALAPVFENIGWLHYRTGNYTRALSYTEDALKIANELSDQKTLANGLNTLAAIQYEQQEYTLSIQNFRKGFGYAQQIADSSVMSRSLNNMGLCFLQLKQLDSAEFYTKQSLEISENIDDAFRISFGKRTQGDIYFERGLVKEALPYYFDALTKANQINNDFLKTSAIYRIGKAYMVLEEPDKALYYAKENKSLAELRNNKYELERTFKQLSDIYRLKGDLSNTLYYQDHYLTLHDSLFDWRRSEQFALQRVQHNSDMQQAQIDLLTKDAMLRDGELKVQRTWNYIFMISLVVLTIIGFILYHNNRRARKMNADLKESHEKINSQTEQLRELNATKDKLFSIIGHDLRSPLASLRALMELANQSHLSRDEFLQLSEKLKVTLDFVSDDLDNLLTWARTQLKGFDPDFKLTSARDLIQQKFNLYAEAAHQKNILLENQVPDELEIIADTNHLQLIFRNLITNAIKFCHPGGNITATGKIERGNVMISITDTGDGMSEQELKKLFSVRTHFSKPGTKNEKGLGLGLLLVKEFVERNQGSIAIKSEQGKGATFTVTLKGHKVYQEA